MTAILKRWQAASESTGRSKGRRTIRAGIAEHERRCALVEGDVRAVLVAIDAVGPGRVDAVTVTPASHGRLVLHK